MGILTRVPMALSIVLTGILATFAVPQTGTTVRRPPNKPRPEIIGYRFWKQATTAPYRVVPIDLQMLCRGWTEEDMRHARQDPLRGDPHTTHYIRVYVNKTGEKALLSRVAKPTYPVGTVIVKEKYPAATGSIPELMTIMIKRPRGFDTKNGNWEYDVLTWEGKPLPGTRKHCQSCHQSVAKAEYVFRDYVTGKTAPSP